MAGRREFRDRLQQLAAFENISGEKGVQSIKNAWLMAQQIVVPVEQASAAAELAEFFAAEVIRLEEEQGE